MISKNSYRKGAVYWYADPLFLVSFFFFPAKGNFIIIEINDEISVLKVSLGGAEALVGGPPPQLGS